MEQEDNDEHINSFGCLRIKKNIVVLGLMGGGGSSIVHPQDLPAPEEELSRFKLPSKNEVKKRQVFKRSRDEVKIVWYQDTRSPAIYLYCFASSVK